MKGVMLVNMGGPESPEELKSFLSRMFRDPYILPFGKPLRYLLSYIISRSRYRKSWKKYELIGGTPLVRSTKKTASSLQMLLGDGYSVKYAFSYSQPDIPSCLANYKTKGISDIKVVPLYPQSSYTTTSSVVADVKKVVDKDAFFNVCVQAEFYGHTGFVAFWTALIRDHLKKYALNDPTLVFSAHSIPEYHILSGDTYATAVVNCAATIASELGLPYEAVFQSGMRNGKWIGPEVKEHLKILRSEGVDNLVLVPISFVHENLETMYDLDRDIVPYAMDVLGFEHVSRVNLPETDPRLVAMLADIVIKN
jgi:ferrochelatase